MTKNYSPITDKDIFDIENSFYLLSDPYRIGKLLGQYEIYKRIVNIPGSIVECGVFKGISLIRFLTFRDLFFQQKKVIGFDAFGKFPKQEIKEEPEIKQNPQKNQNVH